MAGTPGDHTRSGGTLRAWEGDPILAGYMVKVFQALKKEVVFW